MSLVLGSLLGFLVVGRVNNVGETVSCTKLRIGHDTSPPLHHLTTTTTTTTTTSLPLQWVAVGSTAVLTLVWNMKVVLYAAGHMTEWFA